MQPDPIAPITPVPAPLATTSAPVDFRQFITQKSPNIPSKTDINPTTGRQYGYDSGQWDDNYWATTTEPNLIAAAGGKQPYFDLIGATQAAYSTPEITAANSAITAANTKLRTRQQALADAQANINDNPFYSEATRVGRAAKLDEKANDDFIVIQNEINAGQNALASLKADAAIKVNAAAGQYDIERTVYQDTLTKFNNLISMGGLDNASDGDIAAMAFATGMPTSMIKSIQGVSQKKNNPVEKPSIQTATDNQGNLSIIAVDPLTGKVISQTTINSVGKAEKEKGGSGSGGATGGKASYTSWASTDAKAGKTLTDMMSYYTGYLTKQEIYDQYRAANYYKPTDAQMAADKKRYGVK